jgi:SAM-dependent methyltransferase
MAAGYDRMVGSPRYNRFVWGNDPRSYVAFAAAALAAAGAGPFLDAGCGSLLFTADLYRRAEAPIIALDRSTAMLSRARGRLDAPAGHTLLIRGDLLALPLRPERFTSILCLGVLHQFAPAQASALVDGLSALLVPGGQLFLTCLVAAGRWPGDRYLALLHRAGEIARPYTIGELRQLLEQTRSERLSYATKGNLAYAVLTR